MLQQLKKVSEELTGGTIGCLLSINMYAPVVAQHGINTIFIIVNTGLAVLISHYIKKWLEKNDKE